MEIRGALFEDRLRPSIIYHNGAQSRCDIQMRSSPVSSRRGRSRRAAHVRLPNYRMAVVRVAPIPLPSSSTLVLATGYWNNFSDDGCGVTAGASYPPGGNSQHSHNRVNQNPVFSLSPGKRMATRHSPRFFNRSTLPNPHERDALSPLPGLLDSRSGRCLMV